VKNENIKIKYIKYMWFMKNTIWQPWSAKWITHVAFKSDDRSVSRTWSRHIV